MISRTREHSKLTGSVGGCVEGRDGFERGWNRLGMWDIVSGMKLNQAKCKVLRVVWSNAKHGCGVDEEWIESSPEEKGLGCWRLKNWTCPATGMS